MIVLELLAVTLLGATTWVALQQPVARNAVLNRRITAVGLTLCAVMFAVTLIAVAVTYR